MTWSAILRSNSHDGAIELLPGEQHALSATGALLAFPGVEAPTPAVGAIVLQRVQADALSAAALRLRT
jgi:hypothetical protein